MVGFLDVASRALFGIVCACVENHAGVLSATSLACGETDVVEGFIFYISNLWPVFASSFLACLVIVATRRVHLRWTARGHAGAEVQSAHLIPTPRIAGLSIALALGVGVAIVPAAGAAWLAYLLLSTSIVFCAGFLEDISIGASPRMRLMAAMASSLIMISMSHVWLDRVDIAGVDRILAFAPVGIVFTLLVTAGTAHAFNLIDGLNGLSSGIAVIAAVSLGTIALQDGDLALASVAGVVCLAALGVWLANYPLGRIFLGDAGAYTLGFVLAWLGVLVLSRHPEISSWAILLTVFWPVMDMLHAIYRRLRRGAAIGAPDRLHFHHVVFRLILSSLGHGKKHIGIANPAATALLLPLAAMPGAMAVYSAHDSNLSVVFFLVCVLLFSVGHSGLICAFRHVCRAQSRVRRQLSHPGR